MLTQVPDAEPRLGCGRHAALLAAGILGIVLARRSSLLAPLALTFACYGALHGTALALSLRPRQGRVRSLAFVASAALLSGSLARLGLLAASLLAGAGVERAVLLVVAVSAFVGALGYGALLGLLRYRLAPRPLAIIAVNCAFAASAALVLMRQYPLGGSAWLAILWWLAFSGGLCAAAARRALCVHEPDDATEQRMS
jgi:hypothetical protein